MRKRVAASMSGTVMPMWSMPRKGWLVISRASVQLENVSRAFRDGAQRNREPRVDPDGTETCHSHHSVPRVMEYLDRRTSQIEALRKSPPGYRHSFEARL